MITNQTNQYLVSISNKQPLKVKGRVQNYDSGRKKIEIKKEIRIIYGLLNENEIDYSMEHYSDVTEAVERLKEIYEAYGVIPTLLHFQKNVKEVQNDKA
mgnify:FL=1